MASHAVLAVVVVLALIPASQADCWLPARQLSNLCRLAAGNSIDNVNLTIASRRLLWHGGGSEAQAEAEELVGENEDYRGEGGTIHPTGDPSATGE